MTICPGSWAGTSYVWGQNRDKRVIVCLLELPFPQHPCKGMPQRGQAREGVPVREAGDSLGQGNHEGLRGKEVGG